MQILLLWCHDSNCLGISCDELENEFRMGQAIYGMSDEFSGYGLNKT